ETVSEVDRAVEVEDIDLVETVGTRDAHRAESGTQEHTIASERLGAPVPAPARPGSATKMQTAAQTIVIVQV
ncbi:MAG: hypothetical protein ACLPZR_16325, partial [Solirubrobacteraceae bacterium]